MEKMNELDVEKTEVIKIEFFMDPDNLTYHRGFTFASALDLNMGYYHIKLDADAQKLCTIVFPW
jgi:hypothetical protein